MTYPGPDLIQRELPRDRLYPWRMLVACMLMNRTTGRAARPVVTKIMERWPSPERLAVADGRSLGAVVAKLGLRRRRTQLLKAMSKTYSAGDFESPRDLPGVGRYASDSWAIFVEGRMDVAVLDKRLGVYLEWKRQEVGSA